MESKADEIDLVVLLAQAIGKANEHIHGPDTPDMPAAEPQ
jgi:hypothetical protein